MDVKTLLNQACQRYKDKPAIIFKDEIVSFEKLDENVKRLTNLLNDLGVRKGDKVAVYLPNCPEYIYSYLAIFSLGAVGVPLDFMLKTDELVSCLGHSEAKVLMAKSRPDAAFSEIKNQVESLDIILQMDGQIKGTINYADLIAQAGIKNIKLEIEPGDPALIMYTSGTTGNPKGILLNYRHLNASPEAMKHFVDLTDQDVKLVAIPLSHIGGFIYIQNCICFGITLVLMERFQPMEFLGNIQKYKVTCFHIVPPMYTAILTLKQIDKFDLSSLRWVVVFGAPSSPEILERFHTYCPNAKLLNGWGMTETCPPNTVTPLGSKNIASVGKPAPNCEIIIVDEHNQEVPAGQIGEIKIRGWVVMDGYYKDNETTAGMIKDGWLFTGDLGRFDAEGFLYIVGRKKEMIKVAGQIVYAPEVEAAFYKHDAVSEVAVIGIPDRMKGETVKAFIVLKSECNASVEDLRQFAREHLANFKVPRVIEIKVELPKNRTGKIDKEALRNEILIRP